MMSRFPKITETFILYEMVTLGEHGMAVELYPLLRSRQRVVHPEAKNMLKRAHFQPFFSWSILRAHWSFIRRNPRRYVRVWKEVLQGTWGSWNFFFGALGIFPKVVRFAYEMQRQDVTHVHAHFASHPAVGALIIHRLTGIPCSFTAHGSDLHVEQRMLAQKVAAAAFVVTVSDYNKAFMMQACGEAVRDKIHVIHCGIDPAVFAPAAKCCAGGAFAILCVASFEEVKGHTYLVEACRLLQERGVDVVCHLVGDGPLRRRIATQIRAAGLDGRVFLHGAMPRRAVASMLAQADVVALPSVPTRGGKREGIPVALMEAMASGVAVVASDLSGIPELVASGCTGLLVPPRDVTALADALQTLRDSPTLRARLAQAGRDKVLQAFHLQKNTATLAALFKDSSQKAVRS